MATEDEVLKSARERLFKAADNGAQCPCCGRTVKRYRRALNAGMAHFLVLLCKAYLKNHPRVWVDIKALPVRGGDYAKLLHWGMVKQYVNDDPEKRSSGLWMPTARGLEFARGDSEEPSHVFLLDNTVVGFEEERIDIHAALGNKFNFRELWHG